MDFFNDDSMVKALEEHDENAGIEPEMTGTTEKPETVKTTVGEKAPLGLPRKRDGELSATDMNPDVKKQKINNSFSEDVATAAPPPTNKMDFFNDDSMGKALEEHDENAGIEPEMTGTTEKPETEGDNVPVPLGLLGKRACELSATDINPDFKKQKLNEDVATAAPHQEEENAFNNKQIKVEVNSPKTPASPKGVPNYSFYASEINWEDDSEDEEVFNRYTLKPKKKK